MRALDEAFAAFERGERALAHKLSMRARHDGAMNPRVLHDHAELMLALGDLDAAEEALRAAIALAANHAAAYDLLAQVQAARGHWPAACRLLQRALELRPGDALLAERLAAWQQEAAAGLQPAPEAAPVAATPELEPSDPAGFAARAAGLLLEPLLLGLRQHGHATAGSFLTAAECAALRAACAEPDGPGLDRIDAFDHADLGRGRGRGFLTPPPPPLQSLRAALFAPAAALADRLRELLGEPPRHPRKLTAWPLAQTGRSRSRWLDLPVGGSTTPARNADRAAFPLRAVLDLGPGDALDSVVVVDQRPGRKVRRSSTRTRPGDLVLVAQRDRLVAIAGVHGLQMVACGIGPMAGPRQFLDLDFDGR